jgi:hypothetical protein
MECPLRHKWGAFPNVPLFFFFAFSHGVSIRGKKAQTIIINK